MKIDLIELVLSNVDILIDWSTTDNFEDFENEFKEELLPHDSLAKLLHEFKMVYFAFLMLIIDN